MSPGLPALGSFYVPRAASPRYIFVPRAASPRYIFVPRATSPRYIFVPGAASPGQHPPDRLSSCKDGMRKCHCWDIACVVLWVQGSQLAPIMNTFLQAFGLFNLQEIHKTRLINFLENIQIMTIWVRMKWDLKVHKIILVTALWDTRAAHGP